MTNILTTSPVVSRTAMKEDVMASSISSSSQRIPSPSTNALEKADGSVPPKRQPRLIRNARHTFFNVYRRLFSVVFIANFVGGVVLFTRNDFSKAPPLSDLATAASANILLAILMRQDYIINLLFKICLCVPLSAPLRLRRMLAKVYEFGGVHSGAAVSSVIWFALLTGYLTKEFMSGSLQDSAIIAFTYVLLVLLLAMIITAYPKARFMSHNTFENVHRWAGWSSLLLFWAELVLFANILHKQPGASSIGLILIQQPAFWFLLISSFHSILPWLRFHKLYVKAEHLSNHAVRLHFTEKIPLFVGLRISDAPLQEWHSFACIPDRDGHGGSLLVSDAGDWTRKTIKDPRDFYYVKGIPVTGVICMAQIFSRVVIVTTGSGIGPCLAVMMDIPQTSCRVLWSTPNPRLTYGNEICDAVKKVDPNAVIIDTRASGRPDLIQLTYDLYMESGAEAVFCISNKKLTRMVVYGMESRGVPAYGPVWDS